MLADTYDRAQRLDLAHEVLHLTPAVPIDDREMTLYRLELLMRTKAVKNAGQVATDTLALDPTNITALRLLGKVSRKKGNPEIMLPFCQAALKHDPGHSQARYELAFAFTVLGRFEEAQKLIDLDQFITVATWSNRKVTWTPRHLKQRLPARLPAILRSSPIRPI